MTRFENVGVFIRERVWVEPNLSRINTPIFSNLIILHIYPPMKMEQTECSETSAYKIQMPGNYPAESIQNT
jgi:hypothetical protein